MSCKNHFLSATSAVTAENELGMAREVVLTITKSALEILLDIKREERESSYETHV